MYVDIYLACSWWWWWRPALNDNLATGCKMSCVGLLPRRCRALLSPPLEMYLSSWEAAQHDTISLARHNPNIISLLCDDNFLLSWPCTECHFSRGHGPRNWCCVQSWKPNVENENQVFWRVTSPSKMCPPDSRLSDRTFSKIHLIPTFEKFPLSKTITDNTIEIIWWI